MWPVYFLQNEYKGVSEGSSTLMYVEHENECYFLYVLCSQSQFQHAVMMVHQEVAGDVCVCVCVCVCMQTPKMLV